MDQLFWRGVQALGILIAIGRIVLPILLLYLLWRIARNLEKPPKLTEETRIVRTSLSAR